MGDTKRRLDRPWIRITLGLTGLLLLPAGCAGLAAYSFSQAGEPAPVDCAEAVAFAHATLPGSARDAHCTEMRWRDTYIEIGFAMPAAEAAGWVAGTFPAAEASSSEEGLHASYPPEAGKAYEVGIHVRYEGGDTALVRVVAYDS
ncbi:hypothetical protein AB0A60_21870 [Streptomyces sp. NPDC046275]|uniref:hypothetical protein n=1 Tax=Streptomyces sp. NPDC046275 TaxID=3157201 RepID=UPI003401B00D